jgi:hypothetical protein
MAVGQAQPASRADLTRADRFRAALAGETLAFAPIVWEQLPELVHQPQANWWHNPTIGQRLIADAAALALADAMFVFVAQETIRSAAADGHCGDAAIDALAQSPEAARGAELVACLHEVGDHAVIAALPAPAALRRQLLGNEPEPAQDAFSDLALSYLQAGVDALAVTGDDVDEVTGGVERAAQLSELFARPVLGVCQQQPQVRAWAHEGGDLGVISASGEWPAVASGVVITPGDVSARWSAERLRAVAGGRT